LYDETQAIKKDIPRLEKLTERQQSAAQNLQIACEALRDTAAACTKSVWSIIEVVQQWLAEKERNREEGRH
jgi:hypothetical protein